MTGHRTKEGRGRAGELTGNVPAAPAAAAAGALALLDDPLKLVLPLRVVADALTPP